MTTLGDRIKKVRKDEKHLTQAEFGEQLGITKQAIANVEGNHSNPTINFMINLYKVFDVNLNWLITGIGEPFNTKPKKDTSELESIIEASLKRHGLI